MPVIPAFFCRDIVDMVELAEENLDLELRLALRWKIKGLFLSIN